MGFKGLIDEVRIYKALPSAEQIAILACPDSLSQIARHPAANANRGAAVEDPQCVSRRGSTGRCAEAWTKLARA